ncbi:MAG: hypothetical protein Q8S22_05120 [Eubacteriales bacterium]|jgi:hypothetical protein|nr:hypothetical protein [Eubacteriales bacterium]
MEIRNYQEYTTALLQAGFSMGGGNDEGIFALIPWSWDETPPYDTPVRWHTGEPDTDPWEWRMRVLDERSDIAYGKVFFKKSGFYTRAWASYFLAARRGKEVFESAYADGTLSHAAKRIYNVVLEYGTLPLHAIKQLASFGAEEKSRFDSALTELQMRMFLTMCGRQQKLSQKGEEYGWYSTVFCTTEQFWGEEVFATATKIKKDDAIHAITEQVMKINPQAEQKKIQKFIIG